jgi:hypothetical protein
MAPDGANTMGMVQREIAATEGHNPPSSDL